MPDSAAADLMASVRSAPADHLRTSEIGQSADTCGPAAFGSPLTIADSRFYR
jgi:hypothetical protein